MQKSSTPIAVWLLIGVIMIIIQIILGGITRLTGSGLSITEWQPVLGIIPPLDTEAWNTAFGKYQEIAQYKKLNTHFTLSDFKFIYFWEWFHRLWGRLLGIVFLIPFIVFLIQGRFRKDMVLPLIVLFILGGVQGLLGWIMVQSGLNDQDVYVSHIRLAIHLTAAIVLLAYTCWFALKLIVPEKFKVANPLLRNLALAIAGLIMIQFVYGAFMAGLKAGSFAPTWPDINGSFLPENLNKLNGVEMSSGSSLINHPLAIHFIHRMLAYSIAALVMVWTYLALKERGNILFTVLKWFPLILVFEQIYLGVTTTLNSYKAVPQGCGLFESNAQLHQVVGMFLFLSIVAILYVLQKEKKPNANKRTKDKSVLKAA